MEDGIELIKQERHKQIAKGRSADFDVEHNKNNELVSAIMLLTANIGFKRAGVTMPMDAFNDLRPETWNAGGCIEYINRSEIEQFKMIGAFAAAEIDRLQNL